MRAFRHFLLLVVLGAAGCVSPPHYFADRGRDVADVFTLCGGFGVGAQGRAGPLHLGNYWGGGGIIGLRGGQFFAAVPNSWGDTMDTDLIVMAISNFDDRYHDAVSHDRGKGYSAIGVPLFIIVDPGSLKSKRRGRLFHPFYTEIGVLFGVVAAVRVGVNPAELADFFLGWFGVDFFADDIEMRQLREIRKSIEGKAPAEAPDH